MNFDTSLPDSWHDLSLHPFFQARAFDDSQYDGELDEDLHLLRTAASFIAETTPQFKPELVALDDYTFFVVFREGPSIRCELYPSMTQTDERCLFFTFPEYPDLEIRVRTPEDAGAVVRALSRSEDLSVFDRRSRGHPSFRDVRHSPCRCRPVRWVSTGFPLSFSPSVQAREVNQCLRATMNGRLAVGPVSKLNIAHFCTFAFGR